MTKAGAKLRLFLFFILPFIRAFTPVFDGLWGG